MLRRLKGVLMVLRFGMLPIGFTHVGLVGGLIGRIHSSRHYCINKGVVALTLMRLIWPDTDRWQVRPNRAVPARYSQRH